MNNIIDKSLKELEMYAVINNKEIVKLILEKIYINGQIGGVNHYSERLQKL